MRNTTIKHFVFLLCLLTSALWGNAKNTFFKDGYSPIPVKEAHVQGHPKSSSIQASIDGHWLSVVFLENLGQVYIGILEI